MLIIFKQQTILKRTIASIYQLSVTVTPGWEHWIRTQSLKGYFQWRGFPGQFPPNPKKTSLSLFLSLSASRDG